MDIVMQERIEKFNKYVMSLDIDKMPIGLFNGKMGICIYFYHQARLTKNTEFEKFAGKLLDSVYTQLYSGLLLDLGDGLLGISLGIDYLVNNNFVIGNINTIIKELDKKIYSHSYTYLQYIIEKVKDITSKNVESILELLIYFITRLENQKLSSNDRFLFENLSIKSINIIENTLINEKFAEPYGFSMMNYFLPIYLILLNRFYKLNFYNYKIENIYDELSYKIKSIFPLLQSNRLFLSSVMRQIVTKKTIKGWQEHIILLENNINSVYLMNNEFRNKNIFPNDGITGFYFMLNNIHKFSIDDYKMMIQKIEDSIVWEEYLKDSIMLETKIGLFSGFSGVILSYQQLMKQI